MKKVLEVLKKEPTEVELAKVKVLPKKHYDRNGVRHGAGETLSIPKQDINKETEKLIKEI
ncbi:MAG: hypothetical protein KAS04_03650 [Candidatus Aenigmarchaeota archaeon]|nr:hypothetical protein [Candidatus Aenigmarchaeota archaeon]